MEAEPQRGAMEETRATQAVTVAPLARQRCALLFQTQGAVANPHSSWERARSPTEAIRARHSPTACGPITRAAALVHISVVQIDASHRDLDRELLRVTPN